MSLPTAQQMTRIYLYGQDTLPAPASLITDDMIRPDGSTTTPVTIDVSEYMSTGAGRFATGAQFELVDRFLPPPSTIYRLVGTPKDRLPICLVWSTTAWKCHSTITMTDRVIEARELFSTIMESSKLWITQRLL